MKIAIFGSTSYIAQYFIEKYQEKHNFVGFSRTDTTLIPNYKVDDFFTIDPKMLDGCDIAINFAAIVHKKSDYNQYKSINGELPLKLVDISKQAGVSHFIQLSSISVYGKKDYIDDMTLPNPTTLYGKSKLLADESLLKLNDSSMKITILRPSMIYGGLDAPGNLQRIIKIAKTGLPLPFKNIKNTRNFMNIDNFCQLLDYIIVKRIDNILILADEKGVSTENLLIYIFKALNKPNRNFSFPLFWKIIKYFFPELHSKLVEDLVIKPSISVDSLRLQKKTVEEGITKMI